MSLLSKFIIKEWLKSLLASLVVLFLLVSIGDIINGFMQSYPPRRIFIEYILKMPDFGGKMLPISALLASLFSVNKLKANSELMAILAAGYSVKKIYLLIGTSSIALMIIQLINLGYLLPFANKIKRQEFEKSRANESKYLARSKIGTTGLIWYKTDQYFTSFKAFDSKNNILKNITIYFISDNHKLTTTYKAESAVYQKKGKWELRNILVTDSLKSQAFPKQYTAQSINIKLNEGPKEFGQFESDITTLSFFSLKGFINRLQDSHINSTEYEVMFYEKISLSLICLVFSLFPLSGVFRPNRRSSSVGKNIVLTLVFSITFWALHAGAMSLGNSNILPVFLASLGLPALFFLIICVQLVKNRTL